MTDYKSNSIKNRNDEKKTVVKKVTKGNVSVKKGNKVGGLLGNIITTEAKSVKDYVLHDILIPTIVDTVVNVIKTSVDMTFYGEVRHNKNRSRIGGSRISYSDYYDDRRRSSRPENRSRVSSRGISCEDIEFDTREDANAVLSKMDDVLEQYDSVSMADVFEAAGYTGNGPSDRDYGWRNLRDAAVIRTREGYSLRLPRAKEL